MTGTGNFVKEKSSNSNRLIKAETTQGIANPLPKRLFTLPEAANYLGRTLWSMRELVWKGSIPIVRERKRIFVDVNDLESYIAKHKMTYV